MRLLKLLATAVLGAALVAGCARTPAPPPPYTVRMAIVDMPTLYEVTQGEEVSQRGFWFSARSVIETENYARVASEVLGREFARVPGVEVYSREDLIIYLARKDQRARRAFPELNSADRAELLALQSPVDYGKSLNVDFVLLPIVEESEMVRSHFTEVWSSESRLRLELWSVPEGKVVWTWSGEDSDFFDSQVQVMEELAKKARKAAMRQDAFGFNSGRTTG
jgi:hypothetical protein